MPRSDFAWVNFDTQFSTATPQATRTFHVEGTPLPNENFYLLIQGLDVNLTGHQILINNQPQPDPDIPPQEGQGRWTTWMDRIPPNRLQPGPNTITIVAAKSSPPGIGNIAVVTDPFFVANIAIHWREVG